MKRSERAPVYRIFLVTVWQEPNPAEELTEQWRFRLEDPHTHQKRIFANPQGLIAALKEGVIASEVGESEANLQVISG